MDYSLKQYKPRLRSLLSRLFGIRKKLRPGAALPRPGTEWSAPLSLGETQGDPALMIREFRGWVYKAVNRRAQDVAAALRRVQQEKTNDEYEDVARMHPLRTLLNAPNPMQTGNQLLWLAQIHADLTGNAYIIKLPNALGLPSELWNLDPRCVTIVPSSGGGIARYEYRSGTKKWNIGPEHIIHFRYPNPADQYYGASPLMAASYEVDIDNASKVHQKAFLAHNPTPRYAIEAEGHLLPATVEDLRDQLRKHHTGSNAGVPLILHQGAKARALDIRPHEINYIESRKMIRDEIVTVYGVPASILGISEDVNRANAEANHFTYALYTLEPLARMWDDTLTAHLACDFSTSLRITHDTLVPRDREQDRLDSEMLLRNGVVSINEERTFRGWQPVDGGSIPTIDQGRISITSIQATESHNSNANARTKQRVRNVRNILIDIVLRMHFARDKDLPRIVDSALEQHIPEQRIMHDIFRKAFSDIDCNTMNANDIILILAERWKTLIRPEVNRIEDDYVHANGDEQYG